MKKKFRKGLLGLLLVPAMFMATACTKDISQSEYLDKMAASAEKYYQTINPTIGETKLTFDIKTGSEDSWTQWFDYGLEDEMGKTADCSSVMESSQTIEIFGEEKLRVTEKTKITSKSFEENEEETDIEPVTSVIESTTITTYVSKVFADQPTQYFAYIEEVEKVDDDEPVTTKSVYTFADYNAFVEKLRDIEEKINFEIIEGTFYMGQSLALISLVGGSIEYYTDGDDVFGVKCTNNEIDVYSNMVSKSTSNMEMIYENGLPSRVIVSGEMSETSGHLSKEEAPEQIDLKAKITGNIKVSYSCADILEPSNFEGATSTFICPSFSILDVDM